MTENVSQNKEDWRARAVNLAESVSYQQNGIVSRKILQENAGTLTLFAFDEGQALSEHTSPYEAFVQLLEGEAEVRIDGKPQDLKRGEMIWMPAGRPHALKALSRFKMLLILIRP